MRKALLSTLLLALVACTSAPPVSPTKESMQVLAQDNNFALVRLQRGQNMADVAAAFLGDAGEVWQLKEVNGNTASVPGQVVAVPLTPTNPSSVYVDGYRVLPILCYHQYTNNTVTQNQLEITADAFEKQMLYLLANDFRILSFAEAEQIIRQGQPIPEQAVVITIDDGYRSIYDVAWPILKKHGIKATLFIYTDFIGGGKALNWSQIQEMKNSGLIEIESHGKSHASLSRLPEDENMANYQARIESEIKGSNAAFKKHLGAPARYISYPYGNTSTTASDILKNTGYALAATVTRGENTTYSDPFYLHRTMIYADHDLDRFARFTRGYRSKNLQ
ncbi:MAG: polysaccharide deacetylase family protein [Halioglobus sp.]